MPQEWHCILSNVENKAAHAQFSPESATRAKTVVYAVLMIPGGNKQSSMQQPYASTSYTELWMNAGTYTRSMFIPMKVVIQFAIGYLGYTAPLALSCSH